HIISIDFYTSAPTTYLHHFLLPAYLPHPYIHSFPTRRSSDLIEIVGAEAIGQPGQRRFRLFAMIHNISVALWMEKEQLNNLSIALDRILAQLTEGRILRTEAQASPPAPPRGAPANFSAKPEFEFQVCQLRISYDERRNLLVLTSIPLGIVMEPGQEPQVILRDE